MIIKGLFRRYKRWNPVHPTVGAFWGMGIGIGCGVGWGPGFGPDVIGYVGAGCGAGFSVGITLAGFGIGLPANCLFEVPYNTIMATRSSLLSGGLYSSKNGMRAGWSNVAPYISDLQREALTRFSGMKGNRLLGRGGALFDMSSILAVHTRSLWESIGRAGGRLFSHKGQKD